MASTYLHRSTGTPTSQTKFTVSAWVKRSGLNPSGNNMDIFCIYSDSSNRMHIRFQEDDIDVINYGGSTQARLTTDRKFRDTNAWYHIVWRVDTTLSTADDRVRLYVNGVQETSFSVRTNPSQNFSFGTNWSTTRIGTDNSTSYFDGLMSHFHYSDGYSYGPDTFGSTDSTTGEWKINTSPTFTLGNNGFTVLKDGNTITDQSSNSNDFSVANGTLTKSEDCPSNVFATFNSLINPNGTTLANGNTHGNKSGDHGIVQSTIACGYPNAPSTAKFYWECKMEASTGRTVGLVKSNMPQNSTWHDDYLGQNSGGDGVIGYYLGTYVDGTQADVAYAGTAPQITISGGWSTGDIMSHAYDASTGKYWQGKNGTWFTVGGGVGNPATGAYPLVTLNATDRTHDIFPTDSCYDGRWSWNFGNAYFKTTAVSSAGTNASGNGIFEYDVPSGYTALSTKGLNL